MLAGMSLTWLVFFSIAAGNHAWMVLIPLTVLVIAALWIVPLSVITADGIRLVFQRGFVAWSDVEWVLDPRPGDEQARLQLADGHTVTLPGVAPTAVPALRRLWAAHRVRH